jgi:hypothetical protein
MILKLEAGEVERILQLNKQVSLKPKITDNGTYSTILSVYSNKLATECSLL